MTKILIPAMTLILWFTSPSLGRAQSCADLFQAGQAARDVKSHEVDYGQNIPTMATVLASPYRDAQIIDLRTLEKRRTTNGRTDAELKLVSDGLTLAWRRPETRFLQINVDINQRKNVALGFIESMIKSGTLYDFMAGEGIYKIRFNVEAPFGLRTPVDLIPTIDTGAIATEVTAFWADQPVIRFTVVAGNRIAVLPFEIKFDRLKSHLEIARAATELNLAAQIAPHRRPVPKTEFAPHVPEMISEVVEATRTFATAENPGMTHKHLQAWMAKTLELGATNTDKTITSRIAFRALRTSLENKVPEKTRRWWMAVSATVAMNKYLPRVTRDFIDALSSFVPDRTELRLPSEEVRHDLYARVNILTDLMNFEKDPAAFPHLLPMHRTIFARLRELGYSDVAAHEALAVVQDSFVKSRRQW